MLKKYHLYFADWRDANGVRRRKGFATAEEAKAHQKKMRAEALTLKNVQSSQERPRTAARGPRRTRAIGRLAMRRTSSRRQRATRRSRT